MVYLTFLYKRIAKTLNKLKDPDIDRAMGIVSAVPQTASLAYISSYHWEHAHPSLWAFVSNPGGMSSVHTSRAFPALALAVILIHPLSSSHVTDILNAIRFQLTKLGLMLSSSLPPLQLSSDYSLS